MSKRPTTATGVMSRFRRPADRLRDLPIWSKLGLIMLVPTLATIVVGVTGLVGHINTATNAERARTLAALSQAAGGMVDHLQNERAFAVMIRTNSAKNTAARDNAVRAFNAETALVDQAQAAYGLQKTALDANLPKKVNDVLSSLDANLRGLAGTRNQVASAALRPEDIGDRYRPIIKDLLAVRDVSAQLANDSALSDHLRAVAALAQAKEYVAEERDVGHQILGEGALTPALRRAFIQAETGFDLASATLRSVAEPAEVKEFEQIGQESEARNATALIAALDALQGERATNIPFTSQSWEAAMTGYNKLFRAAEEKMDADIVQHSTTLRNGVNQRVFIETSVLLAMLLLAMLFAWLVARSMARSLRELRQGALSVAQFGLPQAVSRLRDPALSTSLTPAQLADQIAEPLPVRSRDEFGQVTEAFNAVHLEAVRTAAEQATLRASVATMFVNLARRSQILVDRLIGHLDRLERGEEDPDRLAELFQLDHLATRMRRNDENLLVLAGADSTRVQRDPAALMDVLRAAQSEVEHYTRIEFGLIDREIEVSAHAVNDMVHLVAELFDNATAFSPPSSTVIVGARRMGEGALLTVEDRGIGISREQLRDLNDRLAHPPMVDVAVSRMMGLVVVARLASRHGVRVELRPADGERGTVADIALPAAVLTGGVPAMAAGGRSGSPEATAAANRPAFAEPLALEGGRDGYPGGRSFDPNPPMNNGGLLGANANGRAVPAWSDRGGAPNSAFINGAGNNNGAGIANGANGFYGPRSNEMIPPLPSGPGFAGSDSPVRRSTGEYPRPDGDSASYGGAIPRQLPPNSESQVRGSFVPPVSAPPLPPVSAPPVPPVSGSPVSASPVSGSPISASPISGSSISGSPVSGSPVSGPPVSAPPQSADATSVNDRPAFAPPAQMPPPPPVWPPVSVDHAAPTPQVPETLAAALDMTTEIPRYRTEPQVDRSGEASARPVSTSPVSVSPASPRPISGGPIADGSVSGGPIPGASTSAGSDLDGQRSGAASAVGWNAGSPATQAQAAAAAQIAAAHASAGQGESDSPAYADETMELPIFRELESAWFTTARPAEPGRPSSMSDDTASLPQRFSTGEPTRSFGVPHQAASPESRDLDPARVGAIASNGATAPGSSGSLWRTAADEGWQAARAAAQTSVETTTTAGLPKRTPMAQLVPGGVDRSDNSVQRRTPEGVRGLLSAYHRGVQRGRSKEQSTNPDQTPGGQQSSQAGKEHEA